MPVCDRCLIARGITSLTSGVRRIVQSCTFVMDTDLALAPTERFVSLGLNRGSIGAVVSKRRTYVSLSIFSSNLMAVKVDLIYAAGLLIVGVHCVSHVFSFRWVIHALLVVG
jgi:hypothetical protein